MEASRPAPTMTHGHHDFSAAMTYDHHQVLHSMTHGHGQHHHSMPTAAPAMTHGHHHHHHHPGHHHHHHHGQQPAALPGFPAPSYPYNPSPTTRQPGSLLPTTTTTTSISRQQPAALPGFPLPYPYDPSSATTRQPSSVLPTTVGVRVVAPRKKGCNSRDCCAAAFAVGLLIALIVGVILIVIHT